MNNHVYVLGSNSFSGAHFVKVLLEMGYQVTGISRSPEPNPVFLPYVSVKPTYSNSFRFFQIDINKDIRKLFDHLGKDKPAFVVNFAAQGMVAESWTHPEHWLMTNTVSPIILYKYLNGCEWLSKFVQISTPEVYGSINGNITENTSYNPSTPYAVSKAAADMNLMCFYKTYNFPVVFTRAANVFGACQQLYRIVPRTVLSFLTGDTLSLHGGGHSQRCFVHIEDVANATHDIMTRGACGNIYHISTARIIKIRELVFLIAEMLGVNPEKHIVVSEDRPGKDNAYILDNSKLCSELNWKERFTLEQGIEDVIRWTKDNLDVLLKMPQSYVHRI